MLRDEVVITERLCYA